jgi:3-isopropylmalate/(R)-2-methylmalate dehydratase small subunit
MPTDLDASGRRILRVAGRAVLLPLDDVDTDRIIPARFLRCVTFEGLGDHVFEDDRRQDATHPFNRGACRGASILVVGDNFGCGSSREHAPEALFRWGIRGIVGCSFAEIFFGNCTSMGIPCLRVEGADWADLAGRIQADPAIPVEIDVEGGTVRAGDRTAAGAMPPAARERLVTGAWDALGELLDARDLVLALREKIQYMKF